MVKLRGALGPAGREGSCAYRDTEVHKTRITTGQTRTPKTLDADRLLCLD